MGRLYPAVGIGPETIQVRANFGNDDKTPFLYDPSRYGKEEIPTNKLAKRENPPGSGCTVM